MAAFMKRSLPLLQLFQKNIFELDDHWGPDVKLEGEDSTLLRLVGLFVSDIDGRVPIDFLGQVIAFRHDDVLVPIFVLD